MHANGKINVIEMLNCKTPVAISDEYSTEQSCAIGRDGIYDNAPKRIR